MFHVNYKAEIELASRAYPDVLEAVAEYRKLGGTKKTVDGFEKQARDALRKPADD